MGGGGDVLAAIILIPRDYSRIVYGMLYCKRTRELDTTATEEFLAGGDGGNGWSYLLPFGS